MSNEFVGAIFIAFVQNFANRAAFPHVSYSSYVLCPEWFRGSELIYPAHVLVILVGSSVGPKEHDHRPYKHDCSAYSIAQIRFKPINQKAPQ
jgi:hypothetical protein